MLSFPPGMGEGVGCLTWTPLDRYAWTRLDAPRGTPCTEWLANPPTNPSKGGMPNSYGTDDELFDVAPDYVRALGRNGKPAGYVSKFDLLCNACAHDRTAVVDESLKSVVGHMVAGVGFQALEDETPETVTPCIPQVGEFKRIYDPSIGESSDWYYNDHTFVRGKDGLWHVFAITHAEPQKPDDEKSLGHATSVSLSEPTWSKQKAPLVVDESLGERVLWAPHVVEHEDRYYMFYAAGGEPDRFAMRLATSTDLYTWTRERAALFEDGAYARDPFVTRIGLLWIMYYTATSDPAGGNFVIAYRTSSDLLHWSPRQIAFTDPMMGTGAGNTESPFMLQRPEGFYLFLSMRGDYRRTEVFFSTDPFHFELKPLMPAIEAHAAELVKDPSGSSWYISHCGWQQGGLYLAPLTWSCPQGSNRVRAIRGWERATP